MRRCRYRSCGSTHITPTLLEYKIAEVTLKNITGWVCECGDVTYGINEPMGRVFSHYYRDYHVRKVNKELTAYIDSLAGQELECEDFINRALHILQRGEES